ncbi:MAG TPA: helix-turn-helix domain-containing protein, partial [Ktedonobacteraceae bacterium]
MIRLIFSSWREERRKRAWDLKKQGWKQKDIAETLGVSQGAVSRKIGLGSHATLILSWSYLGVC